MIRRPVSIAILGLLAACGDDTPRSDDSDARTASGEVLEGTVSDAMLPVEILKSQPPLAAPSPLSTGAGDSAADEEDAAEEDGETSADSEAAPSPTGPADGPAG